MDKKGRPGLGRGTPVANTDPLLALRDALRAFAAQRDWDKFHAPKNLAMALMVEAAELAEHFQWLTAHESGRLDRKAKAEVADEIADVLIYLVRLADRLGVDLADAARRKMAKNRAKYPAARVRGSARKYTAYRRSRT
jgi:NTP pyrophosphatase (non-canonical NTP hydrolase)